MIYYIEVNLICIIILLLFRIHMKQQTGDLNAEQRILNLLTWMTVIFCLSDMVAGIVRGKKFAGAWECIQLSNLLYFEVLVIISFLWYTYVQVRLPERQPKTRFAQIISLIPLILFTILAASNPFTGFLFQITGENLYVRGWGVYLHWCVVWPYFLIPTIHTLRLYRKETNRLKRENLLPLICFAIAPAIASIIQMLFYGVTSTQTGITISLALIYLTRQNMQILTDTLTGLNNRRGLENYLADCMQHHADVTYILIMIDVDNFKTINDTYGHMTGDLILREISNALKEACRVMTTRLFLCRYGGDEFLIMGETCSEKNLSLLKEAIETEISRRAPDHLPISVSLGVGYGSCTTEKQFKDLLAAADNAMYENKNTKKQSVFP